MQLRFELQLPIDREALFRFHETPQNLTLLMQHWPTFRLASHEGSIRAGAKLHAAERVGPFWIPMTFEHFLYEPPHRFGERQLRGPFRKCQHIHEFLEVNGGTKIIDHIEVELPMWMGGALATRLFAARRLRRMFEYRQRAYRTLVESGQIAAKQP
jgi:ligand-binding SRPBCC domain-containing protein